MQPTVDYIQSRFDEFNARFFGPTRYEKFVLRINTRFDLPEELIEDTILHEMIHYHIAVNQFRDTSAHGRIFSQVMKRINAEGNRHISISYRFTPEQLAALNPEKAIF